MTEQKIKNLKAVMQKAIADGDFEKVQQLIAEIKNLQLGCEPEEEEVKEAPPPDLETERSKCKNPNENPQLFCELAERIGVLGEATINLLLDVSGSQKNSGDFMVDSTINIQKQIGIFPFGFWWIGANYFANRKRRTNPLFSETALSVKQFTELILENSFEKMNMGTYTTLIEHFFQKQFDSDKPSHIVFEGDGNFTEDPNTTPFVQILKNNRHKLRNVKSLTLFFSPHTEDYVMRNLVKEVGSLLENCDSFIEFKFSKLDVTKPHEMRDVIGELPEMGYTLPPNWISYRDIAFHRDLIASKLADVLKNKFPDKIPEIVKDMIGCVKNKPQLFLIPGNVYSKLYAVLKLLGDFAVPKNCIKADIIKQLKKTRSELEQSPNILEKRRPLTDLIGLLEQCRESFVDVSDFMRWIVDKVVDDKAGLIRLVSDFKFNMGTVKSEFVDWLSNHITTLVKDSSDRTAIEKLLVDSRLDPAESKWVVHKLSSIQLGCLNVDEKFVRDNSEKVGHAIKDGSGISLWKLAASLMRAVYFQEGKGGDDRAICIPDHQHCEASEARLALEQLLSPFGNFSIKGKKLYIMLMVILCEDLEVNPHVKGLAEKAALDNEGFTKSMLYNKGEIEDIWFSAEMARILFRAITLFKDRMFPESKDDPKLDESIAKLKALYKVHTIVKWVKSFLDSEKITREIQVPVNRNLQLQIGSVVKVLSSSWNDPEGSKSKDPYPGLPSLARVYGFCRGKAYCEYFDNPFGTGDIQRIKKRNLKVLANDCPKGLVKELNELLIRWKQDDSQGIQSNLERRWDDIDQSIAQQMGKVETVAKIIKVGVPQDLMLNLLPITSDVRAFIKSKNGLTKATIEPFIRKPLVGEPEEMKDDELKFEHDGCYYTLVEEDIKALQASFNKSLGENIKGSKANPLVTCFLCLDDVLPSTTKRLKCGHSVCKDCLPNNVYGNGSFVEKTEHFCAYCPDVWIPKETDARNFPGKFLNIIKLLGKENKVLRLCHECRKPFGTALECGATRANVPDFCEDHRPTQFKKCPGCNALTERIDGCNHIHCDPSEGGCGEHWCWLDGKGGFHDDIKNIGDLELPGIYAYMQNYLGTGQDLTFGNYDPDGE